MSKNTALEIFTFYILLNGIVSGFAFNSSVCADSTGFDSCWNKADADAISIFKKYCTTGACTDVDNCSTSDANCAAITICVAYTEWINCALNHCWNQVGSPINSQKHLSNRQRYIAASINTWLSKLSRIVQSQISSLLTYRHLMKHQDFVLAILATYLPNTSI
jgi:hypothetical protein